MARLTLIGHIERAAAGTPAAAYRGLLELVGHGRIELPALALAEDDPVTMRHQRKGLGELVESLARFDPNQPDPDVARFWNEEGQYELGTYLAEQLFATLTVEYRRALEGAESVRLVIVTEDPFIPRLPWACLVWNRTMAATNRWTIALSSRFESADREVVLCGSPRLLLVAPEPKGEAQPTDSEGHIAELERALRERDPLLTRGSNLRVARTWDELRAAVKELQPDVVYYYGHAAHEGGVCRLVFEQGPAGDPKPMPVANFANVLANHTGPAPLLVYVNCCRGDGAGPTGVGWQLGGRFEAVVTNRTVAFQRHARRQALLFWQQVLLNGASPEEAVRTVYQLADSPELAFREPHWMTPVPYVRYGRWTSKVPAGEVARLVDPYWELMVDRFSQFGHVNSSVGYMIDFGLLRGKSFAWFGSEQAGLEKFHERLNVELGRQLRGRCTLVELRVKWPEVFPAGASASAVFQPAILSSFGVGRLADMASRLRRLAGGEPGKILLYLRHAPVEARVRLPERYLKAYLQWWDVEFLPALEPGQFCLLGISYRIDEGEAEEFKTGLTRTYKIESTHFERSDCTVLPCLDRVERSDLLRFLHLHKFPVPRDRVDEVVDRIMSESGGHYEEIIKSLRRLIREGLPMEIEVSSGEGDSRRRDEVEPRRTRLPA